MSVDVIERKHGIDYGPRSLAAVISDFMKYDHAERGSLETAAWTADRSADAIAVLMEILVEKNIITLEEALRIAGIQYREIRIAKEGDGE